MSKEPITVVMRNVRRVVQARRLIANVIKENDVLDCDFRFVADKLLAAEERLRRQAFEMTKGR